MPFHQHSLPASGTNLVVPMGYANNKQPASKRFRRNQHPYLKNLGFNNLYSSIAFLDVKIFYLGWRFNRHGYSEILIPWNTLRVCKQCSRNIFVWLWKKLWKLSNLSWGSHSFWVFSQTSRMINHSIDDLYNFQQYVLNFLPFRSCILFYKFLNLPQIQISD